MMGFKLMLLAAYIFTISSLFWAGCNGSVRAFYNIRCYENERRALLKFKGGLEDTYHHLASWDGIPDCCYWTGVVCHNRTRYVVQLNLGSPRLPSLDNFFLNGIFPSSWALRGGLDPALAELKQLQVLDLSNNDFGGIQIPSFLGSMRELKYLNLSFSGFSGEIPHQLGNLSKLQFLDMGMVVNYMNFNGRVESRNLEWLKGMPALEYLNMNGVDLSQTNLNWEHVVNNLSSLTHLHLSMCRLPGVSPLLPLTSLRSLDLSGDSLGPQFPTWIANMSSLESLDLSFNIFPPGPFPYWVFSPLHLHSLRLRLNLLEGGIPVSVGNLTSLSTLDISRNFLNGSIPQSVGNLTSLAHLDLSYNNLSGAIPETIGSLVALETLNLDSNQFHSSIPESIWNVTSLVELDASWNQIYGQIPESMGNLRNLRSLGLRNNLLSGSLSNLHFKHVHHLVILDLSTNNQLVLNMTSDWVPPPNIVELNLGSCRVGPRIPLWLKRLKFINSLDLSNTSLEGTLPSWFWEMNSNNLPMIMLDLSHNAINGQVPNPCPINVLFRIDLSFNNFHGGIPQFHILRPSFFYISNNHFSGPLPQNLSSYRQFFATGNQISGTIPTSACDKSSMMEWLDLSHNRINGSIPQILGNCSSLYKLYLNDNFLSGGIPRSLGMLTGLTSLRLSGNMLSGKIPPSIRNCSSLEVLDIGENNLSGTILPLVPIASLRVLRLRKNNFNGEIPPAVSTMLQLQLFDVSHNNFSGTIPTFEGAMNNHSTSNKKFNHTFGVYYKEETVAAMVKGTEHEYASILYLVVGIDLSHNRFHGKIPKELLELSGLGFLNISYNQLAGKIPGNIGKLEFVKQSTKW